MFPFNQTETIVLYSINSKDSSIKVCLWNFVEKTLNKFNIKYDHANLVLFDVIPWKTNQIAFFFTPPPQLLIIEITK